MSFILDALKKSESDRQRQSGPAIFEVKVTPPRRGVPPWAIALSVLVIAALGINAWLLLRHSSRPASVTAPAERTAGGAAPTAPGPGGAFDSTISASAQAPPPPVPPTIQRTPAASSAPALQVPAASGPALQPPAAGSAPALIPPPAAATDNPDDYAPASEPAAAAAFGNRVRRGTADGVPLYQDAAATPGTNIPQLRLDLHVYAVRAQDRFVMINMHKVHEGDTLPGGVHVESITPEGALLSYNGSRFLLPRD